MKDRQHASDPSTPPDVREHIKKIDHLIEQRLDITFVEVAFVAGGVELIHPYSGNRKVLAIPPSMKTPEERIRWIQEECSRFVAEQVKPHG